METHQLDSPFGRVAVRVYRLRAGWWPVLAGRHRLPAVPELDGPVPRSVDEALARMAVAIEDLHAVA